MKNIYFPIIVLMLALAACKEGALLPNTAPETRIFVDTIVVSAENRLNSVVALHWSGEDKDGYVNAYEIAINGGAWANVGATTDSVFRFDITSGDTANIRFAVRAIDNQGLKDPSAAELTLPVKNTPPVALFDTKKAVPMAVQTVFSVLFSANDPDGIENLDSVFVKINNGKWFPLAKNISFLTFIPTQASVAGSQAATLLLGTEMRPAQRTIDGLIVGDTNRVYVRARDISGAFSAIDSTSKFFLKRKTGDLLVIDDHKDAIASSTYAPALNAVSPLRDSLDLLVNIPPFWETFGMMMRQYDRVFWYSDGAEDAAFGKQMHLEIAATILQQYLNNGGKVLISTTFPDRLKTKGTTDSPIWGFSPIDSLSTSLGQARISRDSAAVPTAAATGYAALVSEATITGVKPFYAKNANATLFTAQLTRIGGWVGPNAVCGSTTYNNGRLNQVFWAVELHKLNKNPVAMQQFFSRLLNTDFAW